MKLKYVFLLLILSVSAAHARDLTDLSLETVTNKSGNEAKQDAFDQATEQATHQLTEEILGPERTARQWSTLRPKLLKSSTRYIVFIKGSTPVVSAGQNRVQVQMRLSPDSLETLLREMGAMGQTTVRVLPLFLVTEGKGTRYAWWTDTENERSANLARDLFKEVFAELNSKLKAKNIYLLDPTQTSFRMSVPAAYRAEALRPEDQVLLAQYLKADLILRGRVEVLRSEGGATRAQFVWAVTQVRSGRNLNEIQRAVVIPSESPKVIIQSVEQTSAQLADELATKLNEAMLAGTLNLNVVQVVVDGDLGFRQQNEFKKLLSALREIKIVRERRFEPSRVTYEVEARTPAPELAKVIAKTSFPQFRVSVESSQDDGLVLGVRALSSTSAQ